MKSISILFVFLLVGPAFGDNIYLNPSGTGDYPSIQNAVVAAQLAGDTIILANGTYDGIGNRDIDFLGKDLILRSASGIADQCIIDCQGTEADPHIGFHIHSGETVTIAGITVRSAVTDGTLQGAIYVEGVEDTYLSYGLQPGAGSGGHLRLEYSQVVSTQGMGLLVLGGGASAETVGSDFLNNSLNGAMFSLSSNMITVESCHFNFNGLTGLVLEADQSISHAIHDSEMVGNGEHGVNSFNAYEGWCQLYGCRLADNALWGCYTRYLAELKAGTIVEHNFEGGVYAPFEGSAYAEDSIVRNNLGPGIFADGYGHVELTRTEITGNQGMGLIVYRFSPEGNSALGTISDCVISNNGGPGVMFTFHTNLVLEDPIGDVQIVGSDIVGNAGDAIVLELGAFANFQVASSIIAANGGLDIADLSQATFSARNLEFFKKYLPDLHLAKGSTGRMTGIVDLTCTDIVGNLSNFSGPFAPFAGIAGNFSADPLFCDLAAGNLSLDPASPCLPGNHPDGEDCGLIGALGSGCMGPNPLITDVSDIPEDQGGQVHLEWARSGLDVPGSEIPILGYAVFRKAETKTYPPGDWHFIFEVPAFGEECYSVVAPTLGDSTISHGQLYSTFFIRAMTAIPTVYFDSPPDSGYSVDNLSPEEPSDLVVEYDSEYNSLHWAPSPDEDVEKYLVFRGKNPVKLPYPIQWPIAEVSGTEWEDHFILQGLNAWDFIYWIVAVDFAGNRSDAVGPSSFSGVVEVLLPTKFTLGDNVPNPFNPLTVIHFELPKASRVNLQVFDMAGRLIKTLLNGDLMEAGYQDVAWRGRDEGGRQVSAGVYFYRLDAGEFSDTKRMMLVK